jgi:hypothetical protein
MKMNIRKFFQYGLMATCLFGNAMAMDNKVCYSTFPEYRDSMVTQNLKLTLIVGCGHGTYYGSGDHTHPDCWCVNLEAGDEGRFSYNPEKSFKEKVQYDEVLDISTSYFPHYSRGNSRAKELLPIRKVDHTDTDKVARLISSYKNTFDVIVLERPLPITLNKPWTLWNAVHMLKVGGELIIDSTSGYDSHLYEKDRSFKREVCPQGNQNYPINLNLEKLEEFGILEVKKANVYQEMVGISNYLAFWGLTDIINVGDRYNTRHHAYQPYTKTPGESLETARRTCILSATKTQETEDKMDDWSIAILHATFPVIRRRARPIANNIEVKTSNEKKENVSKTVRGAPVETYEKPTETGIIAQEISSKEIFEDMVTEEKSKEIKFPSLAEIKEKLLLGRSTIFSETNDAFYVQSIMGTFFGFRPEVKDFDLSMRVFISSSSYKEKKSYTLTALLHVIFEGNKKIPLLLKLSDSYPYFTVQGGMVECRKGDLKVYSNFEKIMVPIEKREVEKVISKTPTADKIIESVQESTPVVNYKPVIPNKLELEAQLKYSQEVVLRALAKNYKPQNVNPLTILSSPLDIFLAINVRNHGIQVHKDVEPLNIFHSTHNKQEHGEHIKLLCENIERNKKAIDWGDAEFRWRKETEARDFWSLQAIRNAYTKVSRYANVATSPQRDAIYAERDDVACKKANEYMRDEIKEWLDKELLQKLVKKGFDWQ